MKKMFVIKNLISDADIQCYFIKIYIIVYDGNTSQISFYMFCFLFKTGPHYAVQAGLELHSPGTVK